MRVIKLQALRVVRIRISARSPSNTTPSTPIQPSALPVLWDSPGTRARRCACRATRRPRSSRRRRPCCASTTINRLNMVRHQDRVVARAVKYGISVI